MMKPVPTPDVCKAEIRREGAKLESSTKEKAIKNAPYTSHHDPYYHDRDDSLGPFDEEDLVTDAAAHLIVATQQQRHGGFRGGYNIGSTNPLDHKFRHSPWDLPSPVYQLLSPLQKQLWNELCEAACISDTPFSTPRFQIKGDCEDHYGGISRFEIPSRKAVASPMPTSHLTSAQPSLLWQMRERKSTRTRRSSMKRSQSHPWKLQPSLLSRHRLRRRTAATCISAGWQV